MNTSKLPQQIKKNRENVYVNSFSKYLKLKGVVSLFVCSLYIILTYQFHRYYNCSLEIKRFLLLGRKTMTGIDLYRYRPINELLKYRNITPTTYCQGPNFPSFNIWPSKQNQEKEKNEAVKMPLKLGKNMVGIAFNSR